MKNNQKKAKPSGLKFAVLLTSLAVVILVAIVVLTNQQEAPAVETAQIDLSGQPILGEEEAPVTVVEFGDFKCPSCKAWGETVYPQLVQDYVDTEEDTLASLAAESVYQQSPEVYWDFHKALFAAQPEVNHDGAWITPEKVLEVAAAYPSIDQTKLK